MNPSSADFSAYRRGNDYCVSRLVSTANSLHSQFQNRSLVVQLSLRIASIFAVSLVPGIPQVQSVFASSVIDDFVVASEIVSPGDFSPHGSSIEIEESFGIGPFQAERDLYFQNNTIGFPEASIETGGASGSQLRGKVTQIHAEQNVGWIKQGVRYHFPVPLDLFSDRSRNDSILIDFQQVASNRGLPQIDVWVGGYHSSITGEELQELALLHSGPFTVGLPINDFVDRWGLTPNGSVFDSINSMNVSFFHSFFNDSYSNWMISVGAIRTGLFSSIPEPSTGTLAFLLALMCQQRLVAKSLGHRRRHRAIRDKVDGHSSRTLNLTNLGVTSHRESIAGFGV